MRSLIRDFSPPTGHGALDDLAPPRHNDDLNDYIDAFTAYAVRVGITSDLHQVHLFIDGLQHRLREAVSQHQPQEMEAAILLARALEDLAATPLVAPPASVEPAAAQEQGPHTPAARVDEESTQLPPRATLTTRTSPARALIPQFGYNSVAAMYAHQMKLCPPQAVAMVHHLMMPSQSIDDIPSKIPCSIDITDTLVHLQGASMNEHEF